MAIMRQQARFIEQLYATGMVDDQEVLMLTDCMLWQSSVTPGIGSLNIGHRLHPYPAERGTDGAGRSARAGADPPGRRVAAATAAGRAPFSAFLALQLRELTLVSLPQLLWPAHPSFHLSLAVADP